MGSKVSLMMTIRTHLSWLEEKQIIDYEIFVDASRIYIANKFCKEERCLKRGLLYNCKKGKRKCDNYFFTLHSIRSSIHM